ncbi:uncharacterized protein METZ01_LOCUS160155, partial [marine metagenome]
MPFELNLLFHRLIIAQVDILELLLTLLVLWQLGLLCRL